MKTEIASSSGSSLRSYRFAQAVVAVTFLLIIAGGNVTSKGAGMAVPDWPTSFGSFNPSGWTSNMDGRIPGVRDEHFHRIMGSTVGLLVTILAIWLWRTESRAWVRRLGLIALLAVIVQGVMGGLRVTEISLALAIIHGCFAQAFFCLVIAVAMVLSPLWPGYRRSTASAPADRRLRVWTGAMVVSVYLQLILGALFRHTGARGMGFVHLCGALIVICLIVQTANYTMARPDSERLARLTISLFLLYGIQVVLGVASYLSVLSMDGRNPAGVIQTYAPTLHVAVGAAILGTSFALALRSFAVTAGSAGSAFPVRLLDGEALA